MRNGRRHAFTSAYADTTTGTAARDIGPLPVWNLVDLYPSMDSPAFKADLRDVALKAEEFAGRYRGCIGELASGPDGAQDLYDAIRTFETLDDTLGRIMSFASLLYAGDTTDTARAKFYGDAQERVTTVSSNLLFFTLELNRIEDDTIDAFDRRRASFPLPAMARRPSARATIPAR